MKILAVSYNKSQQYEKKNLNENCGLAAAPADLILLTGCCGPIWKVIHNSDFQFWSRTEKKCLIFLAVAWWVWSENLSHNWFILKMLTGQNLGKIVLTLLRSEHRLQIKSKKKAEKRIKAKLSLTAQVFWDCISVKPFCLVYPPHRLFTYPTKAQTQTW